MVKLVNVAEMRAIEAAADTAGFSYAQMMENAGRAVAQRARAHLESSATPRVLVLVGPGNNGGDGLVAGRLLAAETSATITFFLARPRANEADANFEKVRAAGLAVVSDMAALPALALEATVIIDALLGTGSRLPVTGEVADTLRIVADVVTRRRQPQRPRAGLLTPARPDFGLPYDGRPLVIAVDLPSGLDADTGALDPVTLHADETVTFEAAKPGLFRFPGALAVGTLFVAPLGLPASLPARDNVRRTLVDADMVCQMLPPRPPDANKGTFGKALILGGSANYVGAPGLAALSAYRAGAGLVTVAAPQHVISALAGQMLEVTWLPLPMQPESGAHDTISITDAGASLAFTQMPDYDAMLIGPGLGRTFNVYGLIETLFQVGKGHIPPLVIDADGLNMLASMEEWWPQLPKRTILTPHPGEMARLAHIKAERMPNGERSPVEIVQADRLTLASQKAAQWECVVMLKGAYTVVADPDGRVAVLPFADAALARAGTGDVLAGVTVGLLAQGLDPFDAAVCAAYIHGYAGTLAGAYVGTRASVLAGDVSAIIPSAIAALETACQLALLAFNHTPAGARHRR